MNMMHVSNAPLEQKINFSKVGEAFGKVTTWIGHKVRYISQKVWDAMKVVGNFFLYCWEKMWDTVKKVADKVKPIIRNYAERAKRTLKTPVGIAGVLGSVSLLSVITAELLDKDRKGARICLHMLGTALACSATFLVYMQYGETIENWLRHKLQG